MSKILYIEAFYGGSHKNFADGLIKYSRHDFHLVTLPEKDWKWRIRSGALYLINEIKNPQDYDILFLPGMISLAELKAHWGSKCPKTLVYLHETQLSYPLPPGTTVDYQFYFTELNNALLADELVFNSHFHRDSYLQALSDLLDRVPEYSPRWTLEKVKNKARVLYPGVDVPLEELKADAMEELLSKSSSNPIPIIVWNHRWEYDKDPEMFFRVIRKVYHGGIPFKLVLLGENRQFIPQVFLYAKDRYGDDILHYGWAESRKEYLQFLLQGDICISTAIQENFGISMVEAAALGCFPLLPRRLSYPELTPLEWQDQILYNREEELLKKLKNLLLNPPCRETKKSICRYYSEHHWIRSIEEYDLLLDRLFVQ